MKPYKILAPAILLVVLAVFIAGCPESEIEGPERINQPPVVNFVNIPVEAAKFSSDTTIFWYGTDIDGFITMFRYAVVEATVIGDPITFLESVNDDELPWIELEVELNDPQTNERIKMSADIRDPVRTYVSSYVFLQAIDNLGAKSKIVYRMFFKNNHFPNTFINGRGIEDPYVNTMASGGILQGVSISWFGEDPIDYPRNPPPFEFQWKMFGPYDSTTMFAIDTLFVESVFVDIYGDFYYRYGADSCDLYPTRIDIDTTFDTTDFTPEIVVDTQIVHDTTFTSVCDLAQGNPYGSWQERFLIEEFDSSAYSRRVDESYNPLTGETWVLDNRANLYNVFRDYDQQMQNEDNVSMDTTVQLNFLFWCQSRDDSKVPDLIPARHWLSAVNPKFEREVIILDATRYNYSTAGFWNWPVYPQKVLPACPTCPYDNSTEPLVRDQFAEFIVNWNGNPESFDNTNVLPTQNDPCRIRYAKFKATQDYYPISKLESCPTLNLEPVTLRDILKHRIIFLIKDNVGGDINMTSPIMLSVLDGIDAGMSCWSMVRAPFVGVGPARDTLSINIYQQIPNSYTEHFGVANMRYTGWPAIINFSRDWYGGRIEDFVGTYVLPEFAGQFPELEVDCELLENRYVWLEGPAGFELYDFRCGFCGEEDAEIGEVLLCALPEIGIVERTAYAEAIYLYKSKYGQNTPTLIHRCCREIGHLVKYDGGVVAVRYDSGIFRTAHFSFSLLPFNQSQAQETFNTMMDWLSVQPYLEAGKMAAAPPSPQVDVQKLRRINEQLHEMKARGLLTPFNDEM